MIRRGAIVAIGVVVVANLWALVGVVRDRSGQPDTTVTLDERELELVAPEGDTSAVLLRLRYQGAPLVDDPGASMGEDALGLRFLGQAQLEAVGFDCSMSPGNAEAPAHYRRALPRPVLIVFAIGGPDWDRYVSAWQARRQQQIETAVAGGTLSGDAERQARAEVANNAPNRLSRLWPIDVGLDLAALRAAHPDRARSVILRGVVRLHLSDGTAREAPSLHGHLADVFPIELSVPAALAVPLEALRQALRAGSGLRRGLVSLDHDPRYEVQVSVGRALQPWVTAVRRLP